ncbi:MAG: hypothetical protein K8L97_08070 [Anaerolineae bacterium]|nr:hypothetical protein [Anaerolineae bacterium]
MKKRLTNKYVLMILSGLVLVVGILGLLWATNALGWRAFRLVDVEDFIGTRLPEEAAEVQFATQNEVARIVWLRFKLPSEAALNTYMESLNLQIDLRSGYTPFPAPNPQEAAYVWWKPGEAAQYRGLYAIQDNKMVEVLTDVTDSQQPIIYVRAYSLRGK